MPIDLQNQYADPDLFGLALSVSIQGEKIVVGQGQFKYAGSDLQLTDDEEYTIAADTERVWITGWVVRVRSSGEVRIVVDEVRLSTPSYEFDDSEYELIHRLYRAVVDPGNVAADVTVEAWHVLPPPVPAPAPSS
jgi:hypothetical protein